MAFPTSPVPGAINFGYARVSTDDQRLELQTDALTKAGVDARRIYSDKASGATVDRPGFVACFKALRSGDTLVIWKLDRLGRNLSQLLQTAERLEAKGCRLRVLTEAIDTSTPMGRFMFGVMGAFAQLEREMIQERTMAGLAAARERGRVGGRKPVLTRETVEAGRLLIADEAEGGEGLSVREAAARLKVGRTTLYNALKESAHDRGAEDLQSE
jgi:DNA invertase Pin-like site-specific DNA recombinase